MRYSFKNLLGGLITVAAIASAQALTIVPTFDSSITGSANATPEENAINAAIGVMQSNVVDNVTVNITFVADESVGLGQSSTEGLDVSYSSFISALRANATSVNDSKAISRLPISSTDPVIGGSQIHVTTPQANLLGLYTYTGTDATIYLKMSSMNLTRPPTNPNHYDLQQVCEHEMDEVLGISSGLPTTSEVWPVDLFRYTTNLVRTFTTSGDNAYFSIDGTNLTARYNMDPTGDFGDWWSPHYPTNWSPTTGLTLYYGQVQDAFSGPDTALDIGVAEKTALDVVGWTIATGTAPSASPKLSVVRTTVNQYTLSWPNTYSGYVLQERTNLTVGAWANSASGTTNPVLVVSTNAVKFYRLFQSTPGALNAASLARPAAVTPASGPVYAVTRVYRPRP